MTDYVKEFSRLLGYVVGEMMEAFEGEKSADPLIASNCSGRLDTLKDIYLHLLAIPDIDVPEGSSIQVDKEGKIFINGKEITI